MYRKLAKHVLVCCFVLTYSSLSAQSPGGVGHQAIWLQGKLFSNTEKAGALNFNPATELGSNPTPGKSPGDIGNLRKATIFTVYQKSAAQQEGAVWQMTGGFGDLQLSTQHLSSNSGRLNLAFEKAKAASRNQQKTVTVISTYLRRKAVKPPSGNEGKKELTLQFGNPDHAPSAGQSQGLIAEFILYETILKPEEINRVETYLALKYGVTLEKNYLNSAGETIWDLKNEKRFSSNIAGIGRDDQATLYQKQATSCSASEKLVIGVDKIVASNTANTGSINNRNYLVWGDNAGDFTLQANAEQNDMLLSGKKWLMKLSGNTAHTLSTEVQIDTKSLLPASYPKENFCLVIDRSGKGDFVPQNCSYFFPDHISPEGIASFSHVVWDTDGSGKDVFSFGVKARLAAFVPGNEKEQTGKAAVRVLSFHVYPNPVKDGRYTITATLDKPADMTIGIYDQQLRLIEYKQVKGRADYLLSGTINGAAGAYIVRLFTPTNQYSQIVIKP